MLYDLTGSGKSKMAALKLNVSTTQLANKRRITFQLHAMSMSALLNPLSLGRLKLCVPGTNTMIITVF